MLEKVYKNMVNNEINKNKKLHKSYLTDVKMTKARDIRSTDSLHT